MKRRIPFASLLIAAGAAALITWALLNHVPGMVVAAAMLFASAINSAVRGSALMTDQ